MILFHIRENKFSTCFLIFISYRHQYFTVIRSKNLYVRVRVVKSANYFTQIMGNLYNGPGMIHE